MKCRASAPDKRESFAAFMVSVLISKQSKPPLIYLQNNLLAQEPGQCFLASSFVDSLISHKAVPTCVSVVFSVCLSFFSPATASPMAAQGLSHLRSLSSTSSSSPEDSWQGFAVTLHLESLLRVSPGILHFYFLPPSFLFQGQDSKEPARDRL